MSTTLRPSYETEGDLSQAALSPDGQQIAFVVTGSADAGIYAGPVGSASYRKLVGYRGWATPRFSWSGDGRFIAFVISGDPAGHDDHIGYIPTDERGSLQHVPGQAFAWARRGAVLYVLDGGQMALVRYDIDGNKSRPIADFHHHHSLDYLPQVVSSSDGSRLVFTSRNVLEDATHVFVVQRKAGDLVCEPLTWVPGADVHVFPFWSPKGYSLGLFMVHEALETTGLVLVNKLEGDGEVYYQREGLDEAFPPAWTPDGRGILLPLSEGLSRLDLADRTLEALDPVARGRPRFLPDGRLAVEGGAVVTFADLPR